jgi:hypothetical protein
MGFGEVGDQVGLAEGLVGWVHAQVGVQLVQGEVQQ